MNRYKWDCPCSHCHYGANILLVSQLSADDKAQKEWRVSGLIRSQCGGLRGTIAHKPHSCGAAEGGKGGKEQCTGGQIMRINLRQTSMFPLLVYQPSYRLF